MNKLLVILGLFVLAVPSIIYQSFILCSIWNLLAVPSGAPVLTIPLVAAAILIKSILIASPQPVVLKDGDWTQFWADYLSANIINPALALLGAYVLSIVLY